MAGNVAKPIRTTSPLTTITLFMNIGFCLMLPLIHKAGIRMKKIASSGQS